VLPPAARAARGIAPRLGPTETGTVNAHDNSHRSVNEIVERIEDLPSIPETLIHILRVIEDPVSNAQALAEVIQYDAPLTAKILRLANSPYYLHRNEPLADIRSCVRVLGYRTVRQVAICVSIASSLVAACARVRARIDYRELWRHSVHTAATARELGRLKGGEAIEDLFTAGLLHDLGKFLLVLEIPEIYDRLVAERAERAIPLTDLERERLGFDHPELGAAYMNHWRFPPLLSDVCRDHHRVGRESTRSEAALVALADYLTNTEVPPASDLGFAPEDVDGGELVRLAGFTPQILAEHATTIESARAQAETFLDIT
jgi:HD-like signal output (HDOD) protein